MGRHTGSRTRQSIGAGPTEDSRPVVCERYRVVCPASTAFDRSGSYTRRIIAKRCNRVSTFVRRGHRKRSGLYQHSSFADRHGRCDILLSYALVVADMLLVIWGDQVWVSEEILSRAVAAHGYGRQTVTVPLVSLPAPYVEYIFDGSERLIDIKTKPRGRHLSTRWFE